MLSFGWKCLFGKKGQHMLKGSCEIEIGSPKN